MNKKIVTIIGARPQFIKAAVVSRLLNLYAIEIIVHTGQHYDENLSEIFFDELGIPAPKYNLGIGSATHGIQTGEMLVKCEAILLQEQPDLVLVYGDTNSTLAGALAAAKLNMPLAHVEAGLRSFNRRMPEEINRVLTDHLADLLFCPSQEAQNNLLNEGISENVYVVGDVMAESLHLVAQKSVLDSNILNLNNVEPGKYYLATIHRAENTDDAKRLTTVINALNALDHPVIFPLHPRTRQAINRFGIRIDDENSPIKFISPLGYLDMVRLEQASKMIITDSGGIQKEAYWLKVPCVTLRSETEWVETVDAGWNVLAGDDTDNIVNTILNFDAPDHHPNLYGDGNAGQKIVDILIEK